MILKHLINPKPTVILVFCVFCIFFVLFPVLWFDFNLLFDHQYISPILVAFLAISLPFFISTGLNNIVYEKNIIKKENMVVSVVYILISHLFVNTVEAWVASFLLLFMFNFLLESYQKEWAFSQFFNSSLLLGCLIFIYPNLIWFCLILIVTGINYDNLNWRIFITIFLGLIIPHLFYLIFVFMSDINYKTPCFFDCLNTIKFSRVNNMHVSKLIWIIIIIITSSLSFFELFSWLYKKSIKSRRSFMTIVWYFILSFFLAFFAGWEYLYFCLLPLSIIIGNYFVYTKNRILANLNFSLLLISSIYYKFMIEFNV